MTKLILFVLSLGLSTISKADNIYFDPNYKGQGKGTLQQPFNKWEDIIWKEANSYFIKRGSIIKHGNVLRPTADNIIIGAYGKGNKPKFISTLGTSGRIFDLGGLKNIQIKDIEVESINNAETCFHFFKSTGGALINCKVSGSQWGIRNVLSKGAFRVINCEISNIADDGIFILDVDSVIIENSHVYDVNRNYFINSSENFSGGDCVQLVNVLFFVVKNNKLDHSSTGNKFCFISSSKSPEIIPTGYIEGNYFIRNSKSDDGDLIYLTGSENVVVKNNTFFYGDHAVYNHSKNLILKGNLFYGQHYTAVYDEPKNSSEPLFFNNTFVEIPNGINSLSKRIQAANNIFYRIKADVFAGKAEVKSVKNCFYPQRRISFNIKDSASIVEDPMFQNEKENNFHLKQGSPCIGTSFRNHKKSHAQTDEKEYENIGAF